MSVQIQQNYYTVEEYLELEKTADYKNEYRDGEILPMTGGTTNHNKIAGNFYKNLPLKINDQDYDIYIGDVKVWIPNYRIYTYPDVMVIKGKPVYEGSGKMIITNPLLIVEVLSKSTQNYDRTDKFRFYRSIPDLQEYILIDQYSFYVEQFTKQTDGRWLLTEYQREDSILELQSMETQISFTELYHRVEFELEI